MRRSTLSTGGRTRISPESIPSLDIVASSASFTLCSSSRVSRPSRFALKARKTSRPPHLRLISRQAGPKGLRKAAVWALRKARRKAWKKAELLDGLKPLHSLSV